MIGRDLPREENVSSSNDQLRLHSPQTVLVLPKHITLGVFLYEHPIRSGMVTSRFD